MVSKAYTKKQPLSSYETAVKLCELGYSVIPSGGGDKHKAPLYPWAEYQERRADKRELENWEYKDKPSLWGIVTGAISGVVVLDADTPKALADLTAELGTGPHILTPRGGGHWYFKHPKQAVKTTVGVIPDIDIRADGGFVNVVGSRPDGVYQVTKLPAADNLLPWDKLPSKIKTAITKGAKSTAAPLISAEKPIPVGERNATLTSLAGSMRRRGMATEAIVAALKATACEVPLSDEEIRTIATSMERYTPQVNHTQKPITYKDTPILRRMQDIEPEDVNWLWKPYIPYGKLTLLEGDPGVGKSWISLAIATALSLGIGLPGQDEKVHAPVLLASAEDGLADTIRPRLDGMGADIKAITAIDGLFNLDDEGFLLLESWITETMPGLLIIDPIVGYLSSEVDIHRANQVRHGTARLAKLATKYGLAILAIRHLTKGGSLKPIYRGLGSIDFTASARSVLMAGCDPDNPNVRGILHIKGNLAPTGEAIGYELRDGFYWTEYCDLTIEKILAIPSESGGALTDAKSFLLTLLAGGAVSAVEGFDEAKAKGVSDATLNRAKSEMKIITYRAGQSGKQGGGKWHWKLPEETD